MGGKYQIRTNEKREFGHYTDYYTDYYANNLWAYIKLRIKKHGQIRFITKLYF